MKTIHWIILGLAGLVIVPTVIAYREMSKLPAPPVGALPPGISSEAGFKQGVETSIRGRIINLELVLAIFRTVAAAQAAYRPWYDAWAIQVLRSHGASPALINMGRQGAGLNARPLQAPGAGAVIFS